MIILNMLELSSRWLLCRRTCHRHGHLLGQYLRRTGQSNLETDELTQRFGTHDRIWRIYNGVCFGDDRADMLLALCWGLMSPKLYNGSFELLVPARRDNLSLSGLRYDQVCIDFRICACRTSSTDLLAECMSGLLATIEG